MRSIVEQNLPLTAASIEFWDYYPAMAPTPGNRALLELYREVSHDLGMGYVEEFNPVYRGAADVSHVAAYGDALDGLGSWGSNNHEVGERLELHSLAIATKRAALLMYRLTR